MTSTSPYPAAWKQFTSNTASHELTTIKEDGLYRHLRMAQGGRSLWGWDIITWPGYLTIVGDIGESGATFTRTSDMIELFGDGGRYRYSDGSPMIDFRYWAEKLTRGTRDMREFSEQKFMAHVRSMLTHAELDQYDNDEIIDEAIYIASTHDAHEWMHLRRHVFGDSYWEVDLSDWGHHFILTCYAIDKTVRAYLARADQ